jgi:hypothetical protein
MKVLVACEFSQVVTKAFRDKGHEAYSCDLLPTEGNPDWHIQDDVLEHLDEGWDLMIAHPPCTRIANSGVSWLSRNLWDEMRESALFFKKFIDAKIPKISVENPIPHHYAIEIIGKSYDQLIQPFQFGEDASKSTCLWLKNLCKLKPTRFIEPHYRCPCGGYPFEYALGKYGCPNCCGEHIARLVWGNQTPSGQNNEPPSINRATNRARTYPGIAQAMANQWG